MAMSPVWRHALRWNSSHKKHRPHKNPPSVAYGTWTKVNDKWAVRVNGEPLAQGTRVRVARKSGVSAVVILKEILASNDHNSTYNFEDIHP